LTLTYCVTEWYYQPTQKHLPFGIWLVHDAINLLIFWMKRRFIVLGVGQPVCSYNHGTPRLIEGPVALSVGAASKRAVYRVPVPTSATGRQSGPPDHTQCRASMPHLVSMRTQVKLGDHVSFWAPFRLSLALGYLLSKPIPPLTKSFISHGVRDARA